MTIPLKCEAGQTEPITYIVRHGNGDRTRVTVNPPPAATVVAAAPAPAPAPVVAAPAPAPRPAAPAAMETVYVTCPQRSGVSKVYTNDGRTIPVRCGPQSQPAVTYIVAHPDGVRTRVVTQTTATTAAPVAQQVAAVATVTPAPPVTTPPGYRTAWTDDRLNPNRGPRTATGNAQMNLIWTQTVPRRLIDTYTGNDVTAFFRNLFYPNMPTQAQIAQVAAGNTVVVTHTARRRTDASAVVQPAPSQAAAASKRYVQVGTFGVASNAQNTIARLQSMGLPVSRSSLTRGGKTYQIILAGPFTQQARLNSALSQIRGLGFSDAFARN
ncbi:MAG TPA: SPOR domain-containing protein [Aliiroseovarius sp.]|nr:SPOR domain-containing protein [Aliiroseovarius sp.]